MWSTSDPVYNRHCQFPSMCDFVNYKHTDMQMVEISEAISTRFPSDSAV